MNPLSHYAEQTAEAGYAVVPEVLSARELVMLSGKLAACTLPRTRAGLRHAMRLPEVVNLANSDALCSIASAVLERPAIPFRATVFEKSPDANWLVVWHQDTALPLTDRRERPGWGPWSMKERITYVHAPAEAIARAVALRVHLDASTADNGPLRVLPGTHVLGVLNDDEIAKLAQKNAAVECVGAAGDVLVMRPLIVHASSKSRSLAPRRVLHIEYSDSRDIADGMVLAIA